MIIFPKNKIKQTIKKAIKSLEVLGLILVILLTNIPFGTLDFLAEKWSEGNIMDVMWQARNRDSVVDSFRPLTAQAAEIPIDTAILDVTAEFGPSPTTVFTSEQVGYVFFIDATTQDLAYRKTTNGGVNWTTLVVIDTAITGWTNVSVWYDQWTPGDASGTLIHIAAADDASDDIYYTYLDTNGDNLRGSLTAVLAGATFTEGVNGAPSITKGSGDNLFISANFASISGSAGGLVARSTDDGSSWTNITPSGWSSASLDQIQLIPLLTNDDILAIRADTANDDMDYRIYTEGDPNGSWAESWINIATMYDNSTYDQWFSATIKKSTGDVYLAFANYTNNSSNNIEFWSLDESAETRVFTKKTNLFVDNDSTVMMPVPLMDENTGDIYVAYLRGRLANDMNVYFKRTTDGGATWGSESAKLNDMADDLKSIRGNLLSSNLLGIAYYCDDRNDIFFTRIHDLIEQGVNYTISDASDEYGPAPSNLFINDQTGYQFFVRNDAARDSTNEFAPSPAVVFTDANTGYVFFIDYYNYSPVSYPLVYRKTVDGGKTWGPSVIIDSVITGWITVAVWYDRWTPGDNSGTKIHIAAGDTSYDDIFYTYLDTNGDVLRGSMVTAVSGSATLTVLVDGPPSITKDGNGDLYVSGNFTSAVGGKVSKSTNGGDGWADITPLDWSSVAIDQIQLLPLLTDDDIIAIRADTTNDEIDYQIYHNGSWAGSWTYISSLVEETANDDQWFSATIKKSTGDVYLTLANYTGNAGNDIEFWTFTNSGRAWSPKTNVYNNSATVLSPVPLVEEDTGNIYVAYIRGTINSSTRVYYKSSTDGGTTWSAESSTISPVLADDYRYIRGSLLHNDNLYVIWHNDDLNWISGNNLLSPFTAESGIIGQSVVYSKTTDGGKSWSNYRVIAPSNGATSLAIWYDQWTPGDTSGTKVHIAFSEDYTDDYYYTYLDTSNDTVQASSTPVILGTVITEATVGVPGITKGAGGDLFLSGNFNTTAGGKVAKLSFGENSWTDITPLGWSGGAADQIQLLPLKTGNDIVAIGASTTPNTINYRIYDDDSWASSWSSISALTDNTSYDQWFSATIKKSTGDVYLAFANYTNNSSNNIEFWSLDESAETRVFTKKTNLFVDNDSTVMMPVPLMDENTGDIYVAYLRGALATAMNVYYKKSTDGGATWGSESASLSPGTADDHRGLRGNLFSTERLYVTWYNDDLEDIMGNTVVDIVSGEGGEVFDPKISFTQNQSFVIGQSTTAIPPITLSDGVTPVITTGNDIRIAIASTSGFNFEWDTTDTSAVITGMASGKVNTIVSYPSPTELLIDVTTNFASEDTITVSGLSFRNFTAPAKSGTEAITLHAGGSTAGLATASSTELITIGAGKITKINKPANFLSANVGLVGHWTFDGPDVNWATGAVTDRSVNSNHGYVVNMSTSTSPHLGKLGQALSFDGVNQQVRISGTTAYITSSAPFTFSAWVNLERFQTGSSYPKMAILRTDTSKAYVIAFSNASSYLGLEFGSPNDWANSKTDTPAAALVGKWIHVVIVYNGQGATTRSNFQAYLDTVSQTLTAPGGFADVANQSLIGGITSGADEFWIGAIDDVRIYNRALSNQEVKVLYNSGTAKLTTSARTTGTGLSAGLVGHWTFDGKNMFPNVRDSSGQGNHGNLLGQTSTTTAPGKLGQALSFDGTDDYVYIPDAPSVDITSAPLSVFAWVRADSSVAYSWIIAKNLDNSTNIQYGMFHDPVGRRFIVNLEGSNRTSTVADSVVPGTWYFAGFTWDGSDVRAYLNGVQNGTPGSYSGSLTSRANFAIGRRAPATNQLEGALDDVRVYNRVLTPVEVLDLYRLGTTRVTR